MKKIYILLVVLVVVVLGIFGYFAYFNKPAGQPPAELQKAQNDSVVVDNPRIGQEISSPLEITGQAKNWYFEASFPVVLQDANGNTIAQGQAQAQGDWTSGNFVPFKATLEFQKPQTPTGTLILKKDNPSGLPQNDASLNVFVSFK